MWEIRFMVRGYINERQMRSLLPKRKLILIFIVCVSFAHSVSAQPIAIIPVTPKPVGSGARALGQSAFIAVADDATAASWNPAGLINLERTEVCFVGAWRSVEEDYSMKDPLAFISPESWSDTEINFMSYAQPLLVGNTDVVLSLNYHQVYDFVAEFNRNIIDPFFVFQENGKSKGNVSAYTLAGGLSMPEHPEIAIGVGVNWYAQSLLNNYAWHITNTSIFTIDPILQFHRTEEETFDDFRAQNFTLGLLWDAYEKQENLLTFGLVYHTPFTARVDWDLVANTTTTDFTQFPFPLITSSTQFWSQDMDIEFPASLGAGVNYRFSDLFSMAFDVEWKEWSKFTHKSADGPRLSPVDDDTLAYRLGGERLFIGETRESLIACRAGVFYEPRPITNYPDTVPVYGCSAGLGWTWRKKYSVDFAYQYRWGEEDLGDSDYRIEEQFLVASLITYF